MSKEQTPITAEEWLNKEGIEECCDYLPPSKIAPLMEQYANAKVLEALEREFNHKDCININKSFFNSDGELDILSASEYYETEVEPKYKQINK